MEKTFIHVHFFFVGVNSFGYGGSNAHIILSSVDQPQQEENRAPSLMLLSGVTKAALKAAISTNLSFLEGHTDLEINSYCYTLARQTQHRHRVSIGM